MIAHLPRDLVEVYDHVALAGFESTKDSLKAGQGSAIPRAVHECVDAAYGLICDLLWRPFVGRVTYRRRFRRLERMISENKQSESGRNLKWLYDRP